MVKIARDACLQGRRVWWIGLPAQRATIFRRLTDGGFTALGLEVMSSQQAYYRLLAGPSYVELKPLVVGTARLVRVAEALAECAGTLPAPGEVKLFSAAIAEAKRYGVSAADIAALAGSDAEIGRLAEVYGAYHRAMAGRWDYDDVRAQALALVEGERFAEFVADDAERALAGLPDLLIVDGLRELGPLDLKTFVALGKLLPTYLTLPEPPPNLTPDDAEVTSLAPTQEARGQVRRYLAPNAVAEARWVLRSLKRDLAIGRSSPSGDAGDERPARPGSEVDPSRLPPATGDGFDPLELAVIAPPGTAAAVLALADEYGVPIMDESALALADTPEGSTLLDLLELADAPTASRLLALPDLAPLAAEALRLGVAGGDALTEVARGLELSDVWNGWLRKLRVSGDPVAWTRWLLDEVLPLTHDVSPKFGSRVLAMAQEAASLAAGHDFVVWLAALLRDTRSSAAGPGGVALLDAKLASGRSFEKVYVMGAVEGAYRANEREDYFVSEDLRGLSSSVGRPDALRALDAVLRASARLPRRFKGRSHDVVAELLSRGRETIVLAPEAGGDGRLAHDARLLGDEPEALPLLPAGSVLELGGSAPYLPTFERLAATGLGQPGPEFLRRFDQCAFRAWGERVLVEHEPLESGGEEPAEWHELVRALTACRNHTQASLAELGERFPDFGPWLEQHAALLTRLVWGAELTHRDSGVTVRVHAGDRVRLGRSDRYKSVIYRFVAPTTAPDWEWGRELQRERWSEYLAAAALLEHRTQAPSFVEVMLWPLLGEPQRVDTSNNDYVAGRIESVGAQAVEAISRLRSGDVTPTPGFHCRGCRVFEICRVGQRS